MCRAVLSRLFRVSGLPQWGLPACNYIIRCGQKAVFAGLQRLLLASKQDLFTMQEVLFEPKPALFFCGWIFLRDAGCAFPSFISRRCTPLPDEAFWQGLHCHCRTGEGWLNRIEYTSFMAGLPCRRGNSTVVFDDMVRGRFRLQVCAWRW